MKGPIRRGSGDFTGSEVSARCVRCGHTQAEHPENVTSAEALAIPEGQPCHRYEPNASVEIYDDYRE